MLGYRLVQRGPSFPETIEAALDRKAGSYKVRSVHEKLGAALRLFATLLGKAPADQECVILTEDVPAFVRCDGPLYLKGPVWRIEGTSAR